MGGDKILNLTNRGRGKPLGGFLFTYVSRFFFLYIFLYILLYIFIKVSFG